MLSLIITLVVIGVLLWLVNTYIPMDANIKKILNVVVLICVVLWLLSFFGVFSGMNGGFHSFAGPCR
jgi:O-antigen/teichoic acid export membrane protein